MSGLEPGFQSDFTCVYPNAQPTYREHSWKSSEANIYDNFTVDEINQRRKEEILEHKNNSTQLTKNQRTANLLRGSTRLIRQTLAIQPKRKTNSSLTNPNVRNLPIQNDSLILEGTNIPISSVKHVPLQRYIKRYKYT